jgi:hypothetical protein
LVLEAAASAGTTTQVVVAARGTVPAQWSLVGPDAGLDAGVDAGLDAGVDAGVDAGIDAGVTMDAGVTTDAGEPFDAGTVSPPDDAGPGTPGEPRNLGVGCGCTQTGSVAWLLAGLVAWRRRRVS